MSLAIPSTSARVRAELDYWLLAGLVIAAFLMGGGARDDIVSLLVLRPLGAVAFVYALFGLQREQVRVFRAPILFMAALLLLIVLHLVPLPPALWSALPGREIVIEAGEVAGIEQPWRPLAMVPWRAWNAFYAMLLPAAAMLLAIRCRPDQRRSLILVVLVCGVASVVLGLLQAISGYREAVSLYAISNQQSPTGLFANRNHQAAMICATLPLLALYAGTMAEKAGRAGSWVAAVIGAVMLLVLLISGSRAGLVLGVVALGLVALIYRRSESRRSGRKLFSLVLLGAGVVLVALLAAAFLNVGGFERLLDFDASEENRLSSWPIIFGLIWHYFPTGAGIGSFVEVYMVHEPRELLSTAYLNHAHSDPLEWSLDGGLPAMLLILAALVGWARRTVSLVRKPQRHQHAGSLALAGSSVIILLGLASLVDYPLRVPSLAVLAAIAAVWMVDSYGARERRESSVGEVKRQSRRQDAPRSN